MQAQREKPMARSAGKQPWSSTSVGLRKQATDDSQAAIAAASCGGWFQKHVGNG